MSKLKEAGIFKVTIGGVEFTLRRRSTALMLKIGDVRRVFGLMSRAAEQTEEDAEEAMGAYLSLQEGVLKHALLRVDGSPAEEITAEELEPFTDALFKAFMKSGLDLDFTEGS